MNTLLLVAVSRKKKKKRERKRKHNRIRSRQTLLTGKGTEAKPRSASKEHRLQLNGSYVGKRVPSAGTWGSDPWRVNL